MRKNVRRLATVALLTAELLAWPMANAASSPASSGSPTPESPDTYITR